MKKLDEFLIQCSANSHDNCHYPCAFNLTRNDIDADGARNECDLFPTIPGGVKADADGDGINDDHDNCPCVFNPLQENSDGDGYGDRDSCDACEYRLVELPIYGLGRVGAVMPDIDITNDSPPTTHFTRRLNRKFYELTDHLGNVRAVLGDRKRTSTPGAGNYFGEIRSYGHVCADTNVYLPFATE